MKNCPCSALSLLILTGVCLAVPVLEETIKEVERSITEENVYKQFTADILGHDGRKHSNKFNVVSGASEAAVNFMCQLYHNVVTKQQKQSKNNTGIGASFLSDLVDQGDEDDQDDDDDNDKGNVRAKRNVDTLKADTVVSFITQALSARPNATDADNAFYFDLRTDYETSANTLSELRIFYTKEENEHHVLTLSLYRINKVVKSSHHAADKDIQFLSEKTIHSTQETGWLVFNITITVDVWKYTPEENHGFLLKVKTKDGRQSNLKKAGITGSTGDIKKRPFLVSFFQSLNELLYDEIEGLNGSDTYRTDGKRKRRSLELMKLVNSEATKKYLHDRKLNVESPASYCGLSSLYIKFKDLKWDKWVVAPEGFSAGVCVGSCTYPLHTSTNATNHALIQSLQHLITGGQYPNPCCAPHHMSPLTVFLFDSYGNPVLKQYMNMIVDSCGCF